MQRSNPDDPEPIRLTFGTRLDESAERVAAIWDEIQRRNILANRTAAYDPAWDWRRDRP